MIRRLFAGLAGVVLCACVSAGELNAPSEDSVYASTPAEWGPVLGSPSAADKAARREARSPNILLPTDSGWYQRGDGNFYVEQCNVLVDSIPAGYPGGCLQRLTVMCYHHGQAYVRGAAQQDAFFTVPVLLALYQPPSIAPVGYIQIDHLDAAPAIGVNSPPVPWVRTAAYTGGQCLSFDSK